VEYTEMAKHASRVMEANGVSDVVRVIQGAVEDIETLPDLPEGCEDEEFPVDIIISEWMGYFLLRESMLDTIVRAREKFLKKDVGLMFPSHATMYIAPVTDEDERKNIANEYAGAMGDWTEFCEATNSTYGVNMNVLEKDYDREQKEYYLLSSRWCELNVNCLLADPIVLKTFDMSTCTIEDAKGISNVEPCQEGNDFEFDIVGDAVGLCPVSGFSGWFTVDFKSRTDHAGDNAPKLKHPTVLSTGPENGYTHWGQQIFYLLSSIPLIKGETTNLKGKVELMRSRDNARLYNCRISYTSTRRRSTERKEGRILHKGAFVENVYQIP